MPEKISHSISPEWTIGLWFGKRGHDIIWKTKCYMDSGPS